MKNAIFGATVAMALSLAVGCVSVEAEKSGMNDMRELGTMTDLTSSDVSGVEPKVVHTDYGDTLISVDLLGRFEITKTTTYSSSSSGKNFVAAGFFPGVMSCRGEYRDCMLNAGEAFFYNLVFAGLPTLYGILIEPCVPYYPEQTDSIIGKTAFLKSALIGFSRYSKSSYREERKTQRSTIDRMPLDDAVISAPKLGLQSARGASLCIGAGKMPSDGMVDILLELPGNHPLKVAMLRFEKLTITVSCQK